MKEQNRSEMTIQQKIAQGIAERNQNMSAFCRELQIPLSSFHKFMEYNRTFRSEYLLRVLNALNLIR